jgi:protein-S-isoprenylcysteine O-methyltransferase Ste14
VIFSPLQIAALIELFLCWAAWSLAFVRPSREAKKQKESATASVSRWGLFLVMLGYACTWAYIRPQHFEKSVAALVVSMVLAPISVVLVWRATRHLGKQWRYVAALSQDHELVTTGPYAVIRHPIYTSMFGMLLATNFAWTWWPMSIAAVVFFILGTEVRVRAEEGLLAAGFGEKFTAYRARTRAYLPFIR